MEALLEHVGRRPGVIACFASGEAKPFAFRSEEKDLSSEAARRAAVVLRETLAILAFEGVEWLTICGSERDLLVRVGETGVIAILVKRGIDYRRFEDVVVPPPGVAEVGAGPAVALAAGAADVRAEGRAAAAAPRPATALPEHLTFSSDLMPALSRVVADIVGGFCERLVENAIRETGLDPEQPSVAGVEQFCDRLERGAKLLFGSAKARELGENLKKAVEEARAECTG
ncbi:hypothetical protein AMJ39_00455 [candidate division TA06 bacterium DG_24]|uniref:Uncharacterized protein n=3 Tax=Bacteria division TA06 TaxID=1156500 RepID=A0A0S8JKK7_UNCT6|nr:MAG: hypothetical protein AMJ39_00455 [candidate division TA06 bacterium DG_24]KPK67377.1 MAG: hypothetical protein AMJ82_10780 [candidate division TA06 bacterium SM23_40]KPL09182.1 MAG: hypothetical protein AMJ71_07100 [candidate division TA06 bacterium SM1_40]